MKKIPFQAFAQRHNGPSPEETRDMLQVVGAASLEQLIDQIIPVSIRLKRELDLPEALSEQDYLSHLQALANKNQVFKSHIGQGYYEAHLPAVIRRNILENPGWYTQYTPYQAEISQGRLEALMIYQTVVSDLSGLPLANASLLDEGTAAAEAMLMFYHVKNKRVKGEPIRRFFVDAGVFTQTLEVLRMRAEPQGIELVVGEWKSFEPDENFFGALLQYPKASGAVEDYRAFAKKLEEKGIALAVAADLLALTLLEAPGHWGAEVVVGSTQRFGLPMFFGGPHAGYFACKENYKRQMPGRIIGLTVDAQGNEAYRMALQTREQHIRREKATSNICTAQALLAILSGMYAVWHGPEGLKAIAQHIHQLTSSLAAGLQTLGYQQENEFFFDTLCLPMDGEQQQNLRRLAEAKEINLFYAEGYTCISLNETDRTSDVQALLEVFAEAVQKEAPSLTQVEDKLPAALLRQTEYLTHAVFHQYRSETEMMRYIKRLEQRDLSLMQSMIPLGSCTMKLNAAAELLPITWPHWANMHPFAPEEQTEGYRLLIDALADYLVEITGLAACSFQPNSGAQGEFAGLLTIRAYHMDRGEAKRKVVLIPSSAHGTNPASAVMAGMKVVVVACNETGDIDVNDLREKASTHAEELAALMVTYPSTHGIFEQAIREICEIVHEHGGLVYMDGANMNAQVGYTSPGMIGADVCHLNLHKTFAIPHGGGGPGVGPICVNEKLKPYLPGHPYRKVGGEKAIHSVSSAPYGSAGILPISYGYIRMMGLEGLKRATAYAMLNANYLRTRLAEAYEILYAGEHGRCAHEFILNLHPFKSLVSAEDVAKRLMDYGFHAPTVSFPVHDTFMIEPTESESKRELDRFVEALLNIREEIDEIARGEADAEDNVLRNAPCTVQMASADEWPHTYSREKAAWPAAYLREGHKFWPPVARVDNAYGDRHLVCVCPPIEHYV